MTFCDYDIDDYTPRNCGINFAGIVGIGIIDFNETPTQEQLEDPDFWALRVTQSNKKYWALRNTRGEYNGGEPIYEEDLIGYLTTGATHNASLDVPEVKENRDFWDAVTRKTWKVCLVTAGGLLLYIDHPVTFTARINNQRSPKAAAVFTVQIRWIGLSNPYVYEAPEGIFTGIFPEVSGGISGIFDYTFDFTFG
jgi:hypothetical protein